MDKYNKIYPNRKSARMIAKEFRMATGKKMDPEFVHWIAEKDPNIHEYHYGGETYYASNLRTIVDAKYYTLYPVFLKEKEERKKKKKQKNVDYNPDAWIETDRSPRFYTPVDENRINRIVKEAIDKTIYRK
jgi:hypothetical protein